MVNGYCKALALAAGWVACVATWADAGSVVLEAAGHLITAELAVTDAERQRGLMHRLALPPEHGMLFIYPEPARHCMWMKDTPLPLDVAFLDEHGRIVNIAAMRPLSLEVHCSAGPARYALEMPGGWFARHGLAPGMPIRGVPRALP